MVHSLISSHKLIIPLPSSPHLLGRQCLWLPFSSRLIQFFPQLPRSQSLSIFFTMHRDIKKRLRGSISSGGIISNQPGFFHPARDRHVSNHRETCAHLIQFVPRQHISITHLMYPQPACHDPFQALPYPKACRSRARPVGSAPGKLVQRACGGWCQRLHV